MRRSLAGPVAVLLLLLGRVWAQEPPRRILLPAEEFSKLPARVPDGVFLDGADLERLESAIRDSSARSRPRPPGEFPLGVVASRYRGSLEGSSLRLRGQLDLATDQEGWQSLELALPGELMSASFTQGEAALSRASGRLLVYARGPGAWTLDVDLQAPVEVLPEGHRVSLDLGARGELDLALPESIVPSFSDLHPLAHAGPGAPYVIPLSGQPLSLLLLPRSLPSASGFLEIRGSHAYHLDSSSLRGEHALTLRSWSGGLPEARVRLPEHTLLLDVVGDGLQSTELRDGVLAVRWLHPVPEASLSLRTLRPLELPFEISLEPPHVESAGWESSVVRFEPSESGLRVDPAAGAELRGGVFFLAGPGASLLLRGEATRPAIEANLQGGYRLGAEAIRLDAAVDCSGVGAMPRFLDLELDAQDRFLSARAGNGAELPWQPVAGAEPPDPALQRIRLFLPDQARRFTWQAERLLDRAALEVKPLSLTLRAPRLLGLRVRASRWGFAPDPDVHLSFAGMAGFFLRDEDSLGGRPVSYVLEAAPDAPPLALELSSIPPRLEAQTTAFAHFTNDALHVQAEVRFLIQDAATDTLRLSLPPGLGNRSRIEVVGLDEKSVEAGPQADLVRLRLREKMRGSVSVRVGFDVPLGSELRQELRLPEVGAMDVTRDEATVLLEAADNLALRVLEGEGRELPLEEIPESSFYEPSDRLLAAYRLLARPWGLRVEALRYEALPLLGAVARQASLRSVLLADGRVRGEAIFTIDNSGAQFLPVRLGEGSRLWSAQLDGEPVKPFRKEDRVLLALRPGAQTVRILYETRSEALGQTASLLLEPPDIGIPALRLSWCVYPPPQYLAYVRGFGQQADSFPTGLPQVELARVGLEVLGVLLTPTLYQPMRSSISYQDKAWNNEEKTAHFQAAPKQAFESGLARRDAAPASPSSEQSVPAATMPPPPPPPPPDVAAQDGDLKSPRIPVASTRNDGLGLLPLELELVTQTQPLELTALTGDGRVRIWLGSENLVRRCGGVLILLAAVAFLAWGRSLKAFLASLVVLGFLPELLGRWSQLPLASLSSGVLLGGGVALPLWAWRRLKSRSLPPVLGTCLLALGLEASADEPPSVYRPYTIQDGQVVEGAPAFIRRSELDGLLLEAHPQASPTPAPPEPFALRSLQMQGLLSGKEALFQASLEFEVLGDGWVRVPLGFRGALEQVSLDGAPVALAPGAVWSLLAKGRGRHVFTAAFRASDEDPGPGVRLRLGVPPVAAGSAELRLPDGRLWRQPLHDPETLLEVPAPPPALGGELEGGNWWTLERVGGRYRAEGRLKLSSPRGLPETMQFRVPPGWLALSMVGEGLRGWSLNEGRLELSLEPGLRALELKLTVDLGNGAEARLPSLAPSGLGRLSGAVAVLGSEEASLELLPDARLRRIEPREAVAAWGSGAPPLDRVRWAFAPEGSAFELGVRAVAGSSALACHPSIFVRVDGLRLEAVVLGEFDVRNWPVEELSVDMPEGWTLEEAVSEPASAWRRDGRRVVFRFASRLLGKATLRTRWSSERRPEQDRFEAPVPGFGPAELRPGDYGFSVGSGLGLSLERVSKLTPVAPSALALGFDEWPVQQAFQFRETPGALVVLKPQAAHAASTLIEYVSVSESRLSGQALWLVDASSPGVRRLALQAPPQVLKTLELHGAGIRNIEKRPTGEVLVEFQRPVQGVYPLELSWSAPVRLGEPLDVPRLRPSEPPASESSLLIETDPSLLVTVLEQPETETLGDLEQLSTLPSGIRPELVRWIVRYRAPAGRVSLKVERPKTQEVLQAIVDQADVLTVVDPEGRCRTRVSYQMQNRTEQFLDVRLPEGVELWSARVGGQAVKPARMPGGGEGQIRVPLPKQGVGELAFTAELWFVSKVPLARGWGDFELQTPKVANIPVQKTLWTLWLPEALSPSFSGSFDEALEGELTAEKVLDLLDLQNRLVVALETSGGKTRQKIVDNLGKLAGQYNELDQVAQQQLATSYRSYDAEGGSGVLRNQVSLDRLAQGRAQFDANMLKAGGRGNAPASTEAEGGELDNVSTNWAWTKRGAVENRREEQRRNEEASRKAQSLKKSKVLLQEQVKGEKGSPTAQTSWSIDGVTITDAGAIGSSPTYFDFGEVEEVKVEEGKPDAHGDAKDLGGDRVRSVSKSLADDSGASAREPEEPVNGPEPEPEANQKEISSLEGVIDVDASVAPTQVAANPSSSLDRETERTLAALGYAGDADKPAAIPPAKPRRVTMQRGILSLTLEWPVAGKAYYFKALRAEGRLEVRWTASWISGKLWSLLWLGAALASLWIGAWLFRRLGGGLGRLLDSHPGCGGIVLLLGGFATGVPLLWLLAVGALGWGALRWLSRIRIRVRD